MKSLQDPFHLVHPFLMDHLQLPFLGILPYLRGHLSLQIHPFLPCHLDLQMDWLLILQHLHLLQKVIDFNYLLFRLLKLMKL
jgi:hypothetical protein